jgi:CBS-domain-containing membrane protein
LSAESGGFNPRAGKRPATRPTELKRQLPIGLKASECGSAVPVVDSIRQLVGMVSEGDLLRPEGTSHAGARQPWWLAAVLARHGLSYGALQSRTAGDVMTRKVYSVDEDASLAEIAELLERRHIKRVPVLRNGKLVGIVRETLKNPAAGADIG